MRTQVIKHAVRCINEGCSHITREPSPRGWCSVCEFDALIPTPFLASKVEVQEPIITGLPTSQKSYISRDEDYILADRTAPWEKLPEDNPYRALVLEARNSYFDWSDRCREITKKGTRCSREPVRNTFGYAPDLHWRMIPVLGKFCQQHLWPKLSSSESLA